MDVRQVSLNALILISLNDWGKIMVFIGTLLKALYSINLNNV